jgi:hypothetical protein
MNKVQNVFLALMALANNQIIYLYPNPPLLSKYIEVNIKSGDNDNKALPIT